MLARIEGSRYTKADVLDKIIDNLDSIFLKDRIPGAYLTFKEFYAFKRSSGDLISVEIEQLSNFTKQAGRAAVEDLTFDGFESTIMKIFADPNAADDNHRIPGTNNESLFGYLTSRNMDRRGRSIYRGNHRGSYRHQREMYT